MFEGVRGRSIQGDIAIDDISIQDGACPQPGYCDFQTNFCTWSNVINADDFDFIRSKGSTSSSGTGPTADHTLATNQGSFCSFENFCLMLGQVHVLNALKQSHTIYPVLTRH